MVEYSELYFHLHLRTMRTFWKEKSFLVLYCIVLILLVGFDQGKEQGIDVFLPTSLGCLLLSCIIASAFLVTFVRYLVPPPTLVASSAYWFGDDI